MEINAIETMKLEILDDSPFIHVRVKNSDPLWFNVDSGASACVIDEAICKRLGIPMEGQYEGTGAGAGTYNVSFLTGVRYTLAGVSFTTPQSYAIDLSGVSTQQGRKLDGLLGFDFFQQYVVLFDYEQSIMALYDPKTYDYRGPGESQNIEMKRKVPYVKGKIWVSGQTMAEREWLVDTGSSDTLNDELLAETTNEKKLVTGGRGLGKEFEVWLAAADRVEIGKYHFVNVAGVSGGMKIGGGLLRYFTVIFDYSRNRMILETNSRYYK